MICEYFTGLLQRNGATPEQATGQPAVPHRSQKQLDKTHEVKLTMSFSPAKTGVSMDVAQQKYGKPQPEDETIQAQDELVLRKNRSTIHIFSDERAKKCFCGHSQRSDYGRNHINTTATAQQILQHREKLSELGILGRKIAEKGLQKLHKQVNQP